jgi:hypothetical protein
MGCQKLAYAENTVFFTVVKGDFFSSKKGGAVAYRYGYAIPQNYQAIPFNENVAADCYVYTVPGNSSNLSNITDSLILDHTITIHSASAFIYLKR